MTGVAEAEAQVRRDRRGDLAVTWLFSVTSFLGASLLFAVQPMVTRMLLPSLGGSPAAWNTAMVFFQTALLLGYVGAHLGIRWLGVRRHGVLQVALLAVAALTLPIALPSGWVPPIESGTELWTLGALVVMVGAPFAVLATTSPTLQRWLAGTDHPAAADPYFLYAAGNAGSLLALLGYPLLIDRVLGVRHQSLVWSAGFVALLALTAACAAVARRRLAPAVEVDPSLPAAQRVTWANPAWIVAAAIPSALLLGTTRHLGTDVASVPLLWVVPLAIYLATFVVAFGGHGERALRWGAVLTPVLVLPALLAWFGAADLHAWPLPLHLAALTSVALLAHGRLAASRPASTDLTGFYVALSVGGALGGATAALVAPVVFNEILEYPIALVAGLALVPRSTLGSLARAVASPATLLVAALVAVAGAVAVGPAVGLVAGVASALAAALLGRMPVPAAVACGVAILVLVQVQEREALHSERTFFGVSRVTVDDETGAHQLVSGTTIHGAQRFSPEPDTTPIAYYVPDGPIGQVLTELGAGEPFVAGVIGLGAGGLASYTRPGDHMVFYEIDPAVVRIAENPRLFTFLAEAPGTVEVELGDGRLLVERSGRVHDVLVVDAFSSDAIPVHLLTTEAITSYRDALARDGVLVVHVSNRFFDLVGVVAAGARAAGLDVVALSYAPPEGSEGSPSTWMVAARPGHLPAAATGPLARPTPQGRAWTDDRSDLLSTLSLGR